MLAEIILLRLELMLHAACKTAPPYSPFVPICRGMMFKSAHETLSHPAACRRSGTA